MSALSLAFSIPAVNAASHAASVPAAQQLAGTATFSCSTTFYVDPAGRDSANGLSPSAAWKTLAKVSASRFSPGACVRLKSGAVFSGTLNIGSDDANDPARPVVVTTTGQAKAWIQAGASTGLSIYNTGGVTVHNLGIYGSGYAKNTKSGIDVYTDSPQAKQYHGITVDSVDVSGFGGSGILIGGTPADRSKSGFADLTIVDTVAHANGDAGVHSYGNYSATSTTYSHRNFRLTRVTAHSNPGIADKGTNSGSGIVLGDVNGAVVEYSVAHSNGAKNGYAHGGPVGIWVYDSNVATIRHNESYGNRSGTAADGGGFDLDGGVTNSVMEYNYSHDNAGAGFLVYQYAGARALRNNVVRYNVSQNDARNSTYGAVTVGAATGHSATNTDVYGNTFYVTPSSTGSPAGIRVWSGASNTRFFNNIVYGTGGTSLASIEKNTTTTFLGNDWWAAGGAVKVLVGGGDYSDQPAKSYTSLAAWSSATGAERSGGQLVGKSVDPRLTAPGQGPTFGDANKLGTMTAYRLRSGSPVADAGVDLRTLGISTGGFDFYGGVAPRQAFAIGANEP